MAEDEIVDPVDPAAVVDDDGEAEAAALAVDMGGNRMVPLSALIGAKKELKTLGKRVKELEPVAQRVTDVEARLEQASPVINAVVNDPKLRAAALRIANGTHATPESVEQPDDDPDAAAYAEDMGWYQSDNTTLDVKRAQRVLARLDQRSGRQTDAKIRPVVGNLLGSRAQQNLAVAKAQTDTNGTPYATPESIDEAAQQMGPDGQHLLANPQVMELLLDRAMGIDRRKGRTPKPVDEPLYLDSSSGGRGRVRETSITSEEKARLERLGLTEKDYAEAGKKLATGKGMRLGN